MEREKFFLTTQLASGFASIGKKVLILTSDSQNNILDYTFSEEKRPRFKKGLKAFVKGDSGELIKVRKNLFFIPLESPNFTRTFINNFSEFIEKEKENYDYIFIDSTPTEKLDKVFVSCSDEIVIPCLANKVSIQGALNTVTEVKKIEKEIGKRIRINSIVINMYENIKEQKGYYEKLKTTLENTGVLFPEPIRKMALTRLEEALQENKNRNNERKEFIKNIKSTLEIEISENKEENEFLLEKTKEIIKLQANSSLELGKIFQEVEEKIEDRTYCKWLNLVGYNRVTAFRRYTLYLETKTERGKEIAGVLTFREIENFYKNYEENLNLLNSDKFTLKHFKKYLIE